jgi:hypothetical protein
MLGRTVVLAAFGRLPPAAIQVVIPAKGASRPRAGIHSGTVVTCATITEWIPDSLRFTPASGMTRFVIATPGC